MTYFDMLQAAFDEHPEVQDYRLRLAELRTIGVGIRGNRVGSVYSPFSYRQNIMGGFLVQWRDGTLSRSTLDGNSLPIINDILANARLAAFDDPDSAQFLGPQTYHPIASFSDDVPPLFEDRSSYLLDVVATLQDVAREHSVRSLEGGVGAGTGQVTTRTSRGMLHAQIGTRFTYSAQFDGLIGEEQELSALATHDAIRQQLGLAAQYLAPLRTTVAPPETGTHLVVLHPRLTHDLFNHYVWANFAGSAVEQHRSPFSLDDFTQRRQVFRSDLTFGVDPWRPFATSSATATDEGIPSAPTTYVKDGCLQQPVLDLKYARRLGLPPNTPPGGQEGIVITARSELDWTTLLPTLDDAILVLGVLGLHTQDRSSGSYSLATAQALYARDGEFAGSVKAILNGNFLEHLRDDALHLVRFPGYTVPGIAIPLRITVE